MKAYQKYVFALLASTFMLGSGSAQADPILIDDFDVNQDVGSLAIDGAIPDSSQVGAAGTILGGFRDMQATGDADDWIETRLKVDNQSLTFSNDVDTNGFGTIVWDGNDDPTVLDTMGLGGIDITQNNGSTLDSILMDIISADLPGLEVNFTIYDMNSNTSSISRIFDTSISTPQEETFFFDDFSGNADFTNVGAIKLTLDGPPEIDARIDLVEIGKGVKGVGGTTIPEPSSILGLLTFAAAGAGSMLKRK